MFLWMIPCIWDDYDSPIALKSKMENQYMFGIPFIFDDVSLQILAKIYLWL